MDADAGGLSLIAGHRGLPGWGIWARVGSSSRSMAGAGTAARVDRIVRDERGRMIFFDASNLCGLLEALEGVGAWKGEGVREADERFTVFVERHYEQLLGYAVVLTGDRGEAGDVVHDALLKLAKHIGRGSIADEAAYARTTLFRVFLRRRGRRRELLLPDAGNQTASGVDGVAVAEGRTDMLALLAQLPQRMRAVLAARFYLDLSEAETARLLGCSAGTVKSSTSRGLAKLRQLWESATPPGGPGAALPAEEMRDGSLVWEGERR
ncbi:sigma-70 family RNA polymerase sigma factor [Amycolatopsis sp. NBC_00345]|uniref:sigma-70 family RNA polymerase sigma factor n=1 Tax=Amycolatopsis sp. NBC_00345 TaxID=2975955 RepID=UPI002E256494